MPSDHKWPWGFWYHEVNVWLFQGDLPSREDQSAQQGGQSYKTRIYECSCKV